MEYVYDKNNNCIVTGGGSLAYDSDVCAHFSDTACERLAELHTQHPEYDYLACEDVLFSEGLLPVGWRKKITNAASGTDDGKMQLCQM